MINNLEQIKTLLKFENKNEFYFIQIIQRNKEHPDLGNNNHLIKAFYIFSIDYLDKKWDEMVTLANTFNARIYIHLNRRNSYDIALDLMENLAHNIKSNQVNFLSDSYESVCGKYKGKGKDKTWVIDIDFLMGKRIPSIDDVLRDKICKTLATIEPLNTTKIIANIPTKNGYHLITNPFNSEKFNKEFPDIKIHKNNPTLLYCP
jgi:hypothetical protein